MGRPPGKVSKASWVRGRGKHSGNTRFSRKPAQAGRDTDEEASAIDYLQQHAEPREIAHGTFRLKSRPAFLTEGSCWQVSWLASRGRCPGLPVISGGRWRGKSSLRIQLRGQRWLFTSFPIHPMGTNKPVAIWAGIQSQTEACTTRTAPCNAMRHEVETRFMSGFFPTIFDVKCTSR